MSPTPKFAIELSHLLEEQSIETAALLDELRRAYLREQDLRLRLANSESQLERTREAAAAAEVRAERAEVVITKAKVMKVQRRIWKLRKKLSRLGHRLTGRTN